MALSVSLMVMLGARFRFNHGRKRRSGQCITRAAARVSPLFPLRSDHATVYDVDCAPECRRLRADSRRTMPGARAAFVAHAVCRLAGLFFGYSARPGIAAARAGRA